MGRYYDGDINGKFAFAVQSSVAADRFGVNASEPNYVEYYFDESNLEDLKAELKKMEKSFGIYETPLLAYYELFGANDDNSLSFSNYLIKGGLETMNKEQWAEYHDYHLGKKILECIKEQGDCQFRAEL